MTQALTRRPLLKLLIGTGLLGRRAHAGNQAIWATGNPSIDKPREIALKLLKPTAAQLERAWELHFGSTIGYASSGARSSG